MHLQKMIFGTGSDTLVLHLMYQVSIEFEYIVVAIIAPLDKYIGCTTLTLNPQK